MQYVMYQVDTAVPFIVINTFDVHSRVESKVLLNVLSKGGAHVKSHSSQIMFCRDRRMFTKSMCKWRRLHRCDRKIQVYVYI